MQLIRHLPAIIGLAVIARGTICISQQQTTCDPVAWTQSYDAGYMDSNGAYAGGSEIMHLVPHRGKLYAANGYWMDSRWTEPPYAEKQSSQVLRLDAADGSWQVDLDTGITNSVGARYMKGNILKLLS